MPYYLYTIMLIRMQLMILPRIHYKSLLENILPFLQSLMVNLVKVNYPRNTLNNEHVQCSYSILKSRDKKNILNYPTDQNIFSLKCGTDAYFIYSVKVNAS